MNFSSSANSEAVKTSRKMRSEEKFILEMVTGRKSLGTGIKNDSLGTILNSSISIFNLYQKRPSIMKNLF